MDPTPNPTPPPTFHGDCEYDTGEYGTDDCPEGGFAHIYDYEECRHAVTNRNGGFGFEFRGDEQEEEFNPKHPRGCYLWIDDRDDQRAGFFNGPRSMSEEELQEYLLKEFSGEIENDYYQPVCGKCPGDTPEPTSAPTASPTATPTPAGAGFGGCPDEGLDPAAKKGTYEVVTYFHTAPPEVHADGHSYFHYVGGLAVDTCNRLYFGEMWMDGDDAGDSAICRFPTDKMSPMPVDMALKEQLFPDLTEYPGGPGWGLAVHKLGESRPRFIVLRPDNWIYTCDFQRVIKFNYLDWEMGQAVLVAGGQGYGNEDNQIGKCEAIAFDSQGRFYVSDSTNNRVNRYTEGTESGLDHTEGSGTAKASLVAGPNEKQSNERVKVKGGYIDPRGNAVLEDGSVLVVDWKASRVIRWKPNQMTYTMPEHFYSSQWGFGYDAGEVIAGGTGSGCGANQLNRPHGLATYGNMMWIMDTNCHRVVEWKIGVNSPDGVGTMIAGQNNGNGRGTAGGWYENLGQWVVDDDQLQRGDIIIFHRGWLYIADSEKDKVVRWGTSSTEEGLHIGIGWHGR